MDIKIPSELLSATGLDGALAGIVMLAKDDPEAASGLARAVYDSAVEEYRPLMALLPTVAEEIAGDAATVFTGVLRLATTIQEDEALAAEMKRLRINQARGRIDKLNIMMEAGFTRAEAMDLLLADIAAMKAAAQNVSKNSNSSNRG